jgi:hypothetical protein
MLTIVVAIVITSIIITLIPQLVHAVSWLVTAILDKPAKPPDQPKTQRPPGGV